MSDTLDQRNELVPRQLYLAAWRWHFYAGIVVVPFLALLAITGLGMLLAKPLAEAWHADRSTVPAQSGAARLPASRLFELVDEVFPGASVVAYLPPADAARSAQVVISQDHGGGSEGHSQYGAEATLTVFVDPYQGRVLGVEDPTATAYAWIKGLHGTLLLGEAGDALVEVVAGFAVMLLLTGVYLAWPRDAERWRERLVPGWPRRAERAGWKNLHAAVGVWLALPLLFFLFSGLAWTGVWGGRIVQAWSSIPAAELDAPAAERHHDSLNREPFNEVPWALEQTPLPRVEASHSSHAVADDPAGLGIDQVAGRARSLGFEEFRVLLPTDGASPWTLAASTMSGEVADPRRDRTVHLDPLDGRVLADLGFADYPLLGKAMAAGIPLHQGDLGVWNLAANAAFCCVVLTLCVAGVVSWWRRRPRGTGRLLPPPAPRDLSAGRTVILVMLLVSALVPLSGLVLVAVMIIDALLLSAWLPLRRLIK